MGPDRDVTRARSRGGVLLAGLAGVAVGIWTFLYPGLTALALVYLIAAWAVVRGIFEIIAAFHLRKEIDNEWLLALSGLLSLGLGVLLFMAPGAGALAVLWWIGAFAIVFGVLEIILGLPPEGREGPGRAAPRVETRAERPEEGGADVP